MLWLFGILGLVISAGFFNLVVRHSSRGTGNVWLDVCAMSEWWYHVSYLTLGLLVGGSVLSILVPLLR